MASDFLSKYVRKGSKKSRPMTTKSNSWITNALKSVGYSSFDVLTELMPATMDAAKTTADIGTDIATSIQKARTSDRSLKTAMEHNFYAGLGKDILKNSIEDLKSGKFYNKDRTDQYFKDMDDDLGDIDFDFGDDENFDIDEFDDSIDSSDGMAHASFNRKKGGNTEVTNIVMGTDLGPDSAIVKATEFQTETSVNVGRAVIDNSKINNRAMMTMVGGLRNEVSTSLSTISDNISTVTSVVSESLGKHISLSAKYYEDSISLQTQILEHLKTSTPGTNINTKQYKEYNNVMDLLTSGGALDFKAYKDLVKKQAGNYVDNNMVLSQLKFMNDNKEAMQMTALSPFQKILENTVKSIIPATMQKAMTAFDDQLKETTVAALNQVSGLQRSGNPILRAIGQIFGVQNKVDSTIKKGEYNKGAMSWSGTDHQAITNVIPTLLRKILASVSGTQEIDFDYENGVFRKVKDMEDQFERDKKSRETSGFSDYKSGFKEFMDKNFAASREDKSKMSDEFEKFISKLVKDSAGGRTFRLGGRNGQKTGDDGKLVDDIRDLLGKSSSDDRDVKAIRSYLEYLSKSDPASLTRFFGGAIQDQRATIDRQVRQMQLDPIRYNTKYMDTGLTGDNATDAHLEFKNKNDKTAVTGIKSGVSAGTLDKFGNNQNYYLREILNTLNTGIYVVPVGSLGGGKSRRRARVDSKDKDLISSIDERRDKVNTKFETEKKKATQVANSQKQKPTVYTEDKRQKDIDKGGMFDPNSDNFNPFVVADKASAESKVDMSTEDKTFLGKIADKLPKDSNAAKLFGRLEKGRNKIGEKGTSIFKALDKALFDVVFGDGEGRKGAASIFNKAMGVLKSGFASFGTFLDTKIFKPLDNALFGEDGFVNKIKQSDFGKTISDKFKELKGKASNFFLGELDSEGNRSGGLFSETANSLKGIGTQVKNAIMGEKGPDGKPLPLDQDNSVVGNIKRMVKGVTGNISDALGLKKSDEPLGTRLNNTINTAFNRIKERTKEWSDNIFGQEDKDGNKINSVFNSEFASQFKEDMKGQKGYIGATTTIGLLSSFFLPGGPIGGALVGAGVGIVSKSNGLKDFLFGEADDNGERVGGLITKDVQKFFKDNKTGMAVGATAGLGASIGLLPSFFLPGGPIGGALIGTTASLIAKSGAFNTLLYGEGGTKDDPTGGLMANIKKAFGKDKNLKNVGIDAGIGAGVGVLGSFFLPGGPLIHALLGSALSVGTATDKFKNWFFGEEKDGKRSGGVFNRFTGYMKDKIFDPLSKSVKIAQSHIMQFVQENMVIPFKFAMDPLITEAKHVKDVVKEKVSNVFDGLKTSLNKRVVKPIGDTLDKYLITPIKNTLNKLFSGLGKVIGGIIAAPFKMISGAGYAAYDKQKKRGKEDYINNAGREDDSFFGRIKGAFKRTGMRMGLVDREGVEAAQYSDKGAYYERGQTVDRREREEAAKAEVRRKGEEERAAIRNGTDVPKKSNKGTKVNSENKEDNKKVSLKKEDKQSKVDTKSSTSNGKVSLKKDTTPKVDTNLDTGKTRVRNVAIPKNTPNKDQKKVYKNAYKEAYAKGLRGDELRKWVEDHKFGSDKSKGTKISTNGKSIKGDNYKPGRDKSHNTKLDTNATKVASSNYKPEKGKDTGTLISKIQKDISKISDSVYGQLNGVGSNVNKIYKLLLKRFGKKDEDIKGDNNKEYVGFWGKIRTALNNPIKALKSAITAPLKAAKNVVLAPFRLIANIGKNIGNTFKKIGTGVAKAGKAIISGFGSVVKGLGSVVLDVVHTGLSVVREALPVLGEVVKSGVKVIGTGLEVAGNVLVTGVKTVGNVISGAAKGLGSLIGGAMSGLGNLLGAVGLIGKDVLKGIWSGLKFVGKGALKVGKGVVTAPFKLIGGIVDHFKGKGKGKLGKGKGPVHVIVDSGTLDKVKVVDLVKKITGISSSEGSDIKSKISDVVDNTPKLPSVDITPSLPMNLQTFASKKSNDSGNEKKETGVSKLKSSIGEAKDKIKGAGKSIRDKLKAKDDAERAEQVKKGSRSSLLGRLNAADKEKEESSFKTKLLGLMGRSADASEEHKASFIKTFDLKKGLITAGILMLAPFIIKLFKKFDIGSLLTSLVENISTGFKEIGGLLGLVNNVEEKTDQAKAVVTGDEKQYKIDKDGNLVYDENGNPVKETKHVGHVAALLTPTKTRINTDTGKWENEQMWTSTSDSIVNYAGHKAIGVGKTGLKIYDKGKKVVGAAKKVGTGIKNTGKKVFDYATSKSDKLTSAYVYADDAIKSVKGKIGEKATSVVSKATNNKVVNAVKGKASTIAEKSKNVAANVATKAKEKGTKLATTAKNKAVDFGTTLGGKTKDVVKKIADKSKAKGGIMDTAITMMGKAIDLIVSKFKDLGTKYGAKITEGALGTVLKKVRGILSPEKLKKYTSKISEFVTKITGKSSVAAGTLFLADIGFAVYGILDGACNAGAMFEVNPDDVDAKMRAIAAVFKGLLNTSIGSWVDLVSSLVYEILGFNFLKSVATYVYKLISNDKDDKKLEDAQKQFTEDYEKTVEQEYEAYVKNTKAQGKTPMSLEEFKASDLSTTRSEYNSKVNKSLGKRVVDGVKGIGKKIGNTKVGKAVTGVAKKVGSGAKSLAKKVANSKVGKVVGGAATAVGGAVATGVKTVGKGIGSVAKGIGKGIGGAATAIGGALFGKKKSKSKDSDSTKTSSSKKSKSKSSTKAKGTSSDSSSKITSEAEDVIHVIIDGGTLDRVKVVEALSSSGNKSSIGKSVFSKIKSGRRTKLNSSNRSGGTTSDSKSGILKKAAKGAFGIMTSTMNPVGTAMNLGKKAFNTLKKKNNSSKKSSTSKVSSFVNKLNNFIDPKKSTSGWDKIAIGNTNSDDVVESVSSSIIKQLMWIYVGTVRNIKSAFSTLSSSSISSSSSGGLVSTGLKTASNVVKTGVSTAKSIGSTVVSGAKTIGNKLGEIGSSIWGAITGKGGDDGGHPIGGMGSTTVNETPYYSQNDPRYKNKSYSGTNNTFGNLNSTMGESGCGPTAMAMAASKVTGKDYNPISMAKMAENGGYTSAIGTSPAYFSNTANALGIPNAQSVPNADNLAGSLANGNSVILQGIRNGQNNSPYTREGHYVTATGIDKNGNVIVNDPRGKEYSGAYRMSDVMRDTTSMWSFGKGGFGSPKQKFFNHKGIIVGGKGADTNTWISIVKAVKAAIAAQKPGYSQSKFIKITVGGKELSVRTDCSGFVSACLKYFGVLSDNINLDSRSITSQSGGMKNTGFTYGGWPGWDSLQEGDVLARNGHTEIFAYNKDGKHYVYNCGSDSSVNSAEATVTGHPNGYTAVWRCGSAGTGVVSGTDVSGSSSSSSSSGVSSFSELLGGLADAFTNPIMEALGFKVSSDDSSGDSGYSTEDVNLSGSDNAQKIWNYFKGQGLNSYGIAGLMGNLQQESSLNPKDLEGTYEKKLGYTDDSYTSAVDSGSYSNFVNDKAGYGLAQWTYHSLKQELLDYKKQTGKSIGDLGMQLSFLSQQLQGSYPDVWNGLKSATSVRSASDNVMLNFERPKDQGESAKSKRAGYGQSFYNMYAGGSGGTDGGKPIKTTDHDLGNFGGKGPTKEKITVSSSSMQDASSASAAKVVERNNTVKAMSNEEMAQTFNLIVDYLSKIADNTGATSSELETLNSKDFGTTQTTNNVSTTNNSYNNKQKTQDRDKTADRSDYDMARRVAAGILT